MPAGLSGAGYLAIVLEVTKGTYLDPSTGGSVFVPIISEDLKYTEDRYFSPQIRETTIVSDVKQGYYHVEGDVKMEVDPNFLPYFLHCSRHTITKSGAGPYTYKYVPSNAGATSTAASGNVQRTASLTVVRNGVGFGYGGCTMGGFEFTIEDGVLMVTFNVVGESEATPAALGTPAWVAPNLLGADAHAVSVAASATAPTFGAVSTDFNGFTFRANYNCEPQNRIVTSRSATYVKFGETEANLETELDFIDKTEYDLFKASTQKATKLESANGGVGYTAGTSGVKIQVNRGVYETYDIGLSGIGDTVMAGVTARSIGIAGGDPYEIHVKAPSTNIA